MQASIYCHRHSPDKFIPQGAPAVLHLLPILVLNPSGKGADPEKVPNLTTDVLQFTEINLLLRGCVCGRYTRPSSMDF